MSKKDELSKIELTSTMRDELLRALTNSCFNCVDSSILKAFKISTAFFELLEDGDKSENNGITLDRALKIDILQILEKGIIKRDSALIKSIPSGKESFLKAMMMADDQ